MPYTASEQAAYNFGYQAGLQAAAKQNAEPLTLDDVKKMSQQEVIERKAEVDAVMAGSKS